MTTRAYTCNDCGRSFETNEGFLKHMDKAHGQPKPVVLKPEVEEAIQLLDELKDDQHFSARLRARITEVIAKVRGTK